jgi:hypothetical protein
LDTVPLSSKASIKVKPMSLRSIVIPAGMIAVGAFFLASEDLKHLNLSVRRAVWENRGYLWHVGFIGWRHCKTCKTFNGCDAP